MPALPQARAARRSVRTATRRPSHLQHNGNLEAHYCSTHTEAGSLSRKAAVSNTANS